MQSDIHWNNKLKKIYVKSAQQYKVERIRAKRRRDGINNGIVLLSNYLNCDQSFKFWPKHNIIKGCIELIEELENKIATLKSEREILNYMIGEIDFKSKMNNSSE